MSTCYRIVIDPAQREIIKHYGKLTPGDLVHIDLTKVSKDLLLIFKVKNLYIAAFENDCT
ncbi:MAG: hypothetical protein PHW73_07555 [Atribacterota bacterium]|nr:hypothetical protein [Atribacterota bacterium]